MFLKRKSQFFCCHLGWSSLICEQLWVKYRGGPLKERTHLLAVLVALKMSPTIDQLSRVLHMPKSSAQTLIQEGFAYLQNVVDEVNWDDRLSPLNHTTHFPYYVSFFVIQGIAFFPQFSCISGYTLFCDTVPVACFCGSVPENFQPKYSGPGCFFKGFNPLEKVGPEVLRRKGVGPCRWGL